MNMRILALLSALLMMLSLTACNKDTTAAAVPSTASPAVTTTTAAPTVALTDIIGTWSGVTDAASTALELGVDSFAVDTTYEFSADGTYRFSFDPASVRALFTDNFDAMVSFTLTQMGQPDMTVEEYLSLVGMTKDDMIDTMIESGGLTESSIEGTYTFEDGVLTMDNVEVAYTWDGTTLVFTQDGGVTTLTK